MLLLLHYLSHCQLSIHSDTSAIKTCKNKGPWATRVARDANDIGWIALRSSHLPHMRHLLHQISRIFLPTQSLPNFQREIVPSRSPQVTRIPPPHHRCTVPPRPLAVWTSQAAAQLPRRLPRRWRTSWQGRPDLPWTTGGSLGPSPGWG